MIAAVAGTGLGCSSNVSNPPGGSDLDAYLYASETSVLYVPSFGLGRVLIAYNDQSGLWDIQEVGGVKTKVPKPKESLNGISYADDGGFGWIKNGPILPADPGCGDPFCPLRLFGDPWLAQSNDKVLYSSVAFSTASPPPDLPDGLAVATSLDGGVNWQTPRMVLKVATGSVDKPSMSASGSTVVIAYLSLGGIDRNLSLVTSDAEGDTWDAGFPLYTADDDQSGPIAVPKRNPLVRLRSPTLGYVAYQRVDNSTLFTMRIVRIRRTSVGSQWAADPSFVYGTLVNIDLLVPGAAFPGPPPVQRMWRDNIPSSFDLGEGGRHLYFAFRNLVSMPSGGMESLMLLADCIDEPIGDCTMIGTTPSAKWRESMPYEPGPNEGGMYQPSVAASKLPRDSTVALVWYQQMSTDAMNDPRIEPRGGFSFNGGTTWSTIRNLNPGVLGGPAGPYVPCPTPNVPYYGDYFGSAILPPIDIIPFIGPPIIFPWIVTAYASSAFGCEDLPNEVTFDQHVTGIVW